MLLLLQLGFGDDELFQHYVVVVVKPLEWVSFDFHAAHQLVLVVSNHDLVFADPCPNVTHFSLVFDF